MASFGFATPWVYNHSATQRMPLPHILPSLPSALKMRIMASAPAVTGAQMQIIPSAPMEKCRRDKRSESAAICLRHAGSAAVQIDIIIGAALHFGE